MLDKNKIVILHSKNKFFGQTRKPWVSMDLDKIINSLNSKGYKIENFDFHEVVNDKVEISNSIVFYTFSQRDNVRDYIKDLMYHLLKSNNVIIPSYDLLLCHENKGYQEIFKSAKDIHSLNCRYYYDKDSVNYDEIKYPVVLKKVYGSNGKNVFLIKNENELKSSLKKFANLNFLNKADLFRRKYFRKKKTYIHYPEYSNIEDYYQYKDYIIKRDNFVLQEFIPNLEYDFRILVIYDKYFVSRRLNRENDFRASGAKRYDFSFEKDDAMLNYAKKIFSKFDTPILSMDICKSGSNYFLIEFQAIHFGLNVVIRSDGYYQFKEGQWIFVKNKNIIENEIAYGLEQFVKHKIG